MADAMISRALKLLFSDYGTIMFTYDIILELNLIPNHEKLWVIYRCYPLIIILKVWIFHLLANDFECTYIYVYVYGYYYTHTRIHICIGWIGAWIKSATDGAAVCCILLISPLGPLQLALPQVFEHEIKKKNSFAFWQVRSVNFGFMCTLHITIIYFI